MMCTLVMLKKKQRKMEIQKQMQSEIFQIKAFFYSPPLTLLDLAYAKSKYNIEIFTPLSGVVTLRRLEKRSTIES